MLLRRKDVFTERRHAQSTQKQVGKSSGCGEKPLSSYVTPHSLATRMRHSYNESARIEEREFWAGWSVCPRWDSRPTRIFSPHTTWPLPSTSHHSAVQLLPRETSFKLRPSTVTTRCPMPCHVAADSPNPSLLGPSLNHPLTRYFLLHAAAA